MIRATVALLLLAATPASSAEFGCAPHDRILAGLAQSYGKTVRAAGVELRGRLLEVTVSETGTWSILVINPQGQACLVAAGTDWTEAQSKGEPR